MMENKAMTNVALKEIKKRIIDTSKITVPN